MSNQSQDLALKVVLQFLDRGASAGVRGFGSTLGGLGGFSGPAAIAERALFGVGEAALGVGAKAVNMAGDYDQSLRMVQSLTGTSQRQMAQYDNQLKQLSDDTGATATDLANGLFYTISAGGNVAAHATDVLTLSTKDAVIGMTDQQTTAQALTTTLKGFSVQAKDFNAANGEMVRTVTLGKMTMGDYAAGISKSISVAVQYKDTMEDMNAVFATLTANGVKNAKIAGTDYNNLLKVMDGNVESVANKAHSLNGAFDEQAFKSMDVADKIQYLNQMVVEHGHNIAEVIGKQQNAAQAFTILAQHADEYRSNLKALSDQQKNATATQDAWSITQQGFNVKMSELKAILDNTLISIGQQLLPVLEQMADWFIKNGVPALQRFGSYVQLNMLPNLLKFSDWILRTAMPNLLKFGDWFIRVAVPNLQSMANTVLKNLLPPLESLAENALMLIERFGAWAVTSGTLQNTLAATSAILGTLVGWVSALTDGLNTGNPAVALLAAGLASVGTAIGLLKLEEFAAGLYNSFQKLSDGNGVIANLATKAFPDLGQALGWTKTQADAAAVSVASVGTQAEAVSAKSWFAGLETDLEMVGMKAEATAVEVGAIGPAAVAAEAEVGTAATGMSLALGVATVGISLLVGGAVAAVTGLATELNNVTGRMSSDVKTTYENLGNSVDDQHAKMAASAAYNADMGAKAFSRGAGQIVKAQDDAKAKVIVDQQKMADAAATEAKRASDAWARAAASADAAWTQASQDLNIVALLQSAGWSQGAIAQYLAGTGTTTVSNSPATIGKHALGGTIPPGQFGIVDDPGPNSELMYGGTNGITVFNSSQTRGILGGGGARGGGHTYISNDHIEINIHVSGKMTDREIDDLADRLDRKFGKKMRSNANLQVVTSGSVRS